MTKTKRQMAIIIASQLFNKLVPSTNWKVKALMRQKKSTLEEFYKMALKAMEAKAEIEVKWEISLGNLTPKDFKEIDAPGDW